MASIFRGWKRMDAMEEKIPEEEEEEEDDEDEDDEEEGSGMMKKPKRTEEVPAGPPKRRYKKHGSIGPTFTIGTSPVSESTPLRTDEEPVDSINKDHNDNVKEEITVLPAVTIPANGPVPKGPKWQREEDFTTFRRKSSVFDRIISPLLNRRRSSIVQRARLVAKSGESSITNHNIHEKKSRFIADMYTTLMDMKWRYTILVFAAAFIMTWLFFGTIYYIITIVHKDHLHIDDAEWKPCHFNVYDFTTAFLFSLETQHTIGYGYRGMETNCPVSMITLAAQSCMGAFFQCIVTGLVFAKLSRPKKRSQTIMFSEKAVICQRDNELYLLFRVGDMRRSHIINTNIRAIMVKNYLTQEGELIPLCQCPLQIQTETGYAGDSYLFLMWPVTVAHLINKDSPLWDISGKDLESQHFEIIIILEGTVPSNGMTTQVRTSYLPNEILWGHRLAPLLTYKRHYGGYSIDHQEFHNTLPLESTALCSAKELAARYYKKSRKTDPRGHFNNFTTQGERESKWDRLSLHNLKPTLNKLRRNSEMTYLPRTPSESSTGSFLESK